MLHPTESQERAKVSLGAPASAKEPQPPPPGRNEGRMGQVQRRAVERKFHTDEARACSRQTQNRQITDSHTLGNPETLVADTNNYPEAHLLENDLKVLLRPEMDL